MATKIQFHVTALDIKTGQRRDCFSCPVAKAMLRKLKKMFPQVKLTVGNGLVEIFSEYKLYRVIKLPVKAQTFIHNFDRCQSVKPFKFELELPNGVI